MSQKYYLALSLGPIYQTLQQARKTRELWQASFLFSHAMRLFHQNLRAEGYIILSPQMPASIGTKPLYGAGIYPDRLFGLCNTNQMNAFEGVLNKVFEEIVNLTNNGQTPKDFSGDYPKWLLDQDKFWKDYFRIAKVFIPVNQTKEDLKIAVSGRTILELNQYLDTAELSPVYLAKAPEYDPLIRLLDQPYSFKLHEIGLSRQNGTYEVALVKNRRFPSTFEIAALELFQKKEEAAKSLVQYAMEEAKSQQSKNETTDESSSATIEAFYELAYEVPALKELLEDYHKYLCIVHVDGDRFGKTIESLKNQREIEQFSEKLALFAADAAQVINDHGGKPIYIGGDDLLFFAPVKCLREGELGEMTSVFELIEALDTCFTGYQFPESPTLSYGISISYYKYPLFEARDDSANQLFERAKKTTWAHGGMKNAVAFRLSKHSGSFFEGVIDKKQLNKLVHLIKTGEGEFPDSLLSSFAHKLRTLENLLKATGEAIPDSTSSAERKKTLEGRLDNLFTNYFNESIHRRFAHQVDQVKDLAKVILLQSYEVDSKSEDLTKTLYASLRIINFLSKKRVVEHV